MAEIPPESKPSTQSIHSVGSIDDSGDVVEGKPFPVAERLEIQEDGDNSILMIRLTAAGAFCGDTWHQSVDEAKQQAEREYGELRWTSPRD